MALNPNIILQGRAVDALGAIDAGNAAAARANEIQRQNALRAAYRDHGAGIVAGNQNALNALAGIDPMAAMNVQGQRLDMDQARQNMQLRQAAEGRAQQNQDIKIQQYVSSLNAEEAARQAQETEMAVQRALAMPDAVAFDRMMASSPDTQQYVGQFENRQAIAQQFLPIIDQLKLRASNAPSPLTEEGKRALDIRNQFIDPNAPQPVDQEQVSKLRKEFSSLPAVRSFSEQARAFGRIQASAQEPSGAGDLALIFNYMKLLDPGSVVREGEFATAQSAGGVPARVVSTYNNIINGERLTEGQRADFMDRAARLYQNAEEGYSNIERQYRAIADRNNLGPDALVDFRYARGDQAPRVPDPLTPQPEPGGLAGTPSALRPAGQATSSLPPDAQIASATRPEEDIPRAINNLSASDFAAYDSLPEDQKIRFLVERGGLPPEYVQGEGQPNQPDTPSPSEPQEILIATTSDGGRVVERNGQRMFVSPAYSTTDPEAIDRILQGETGGEQSRRSVQEGVVQENPITSRAVTALRGVPFVGSYLDEAAGAMFGPRAAAGVQAVGDALEETRPGQAAALRAAGTVAGAVPLVAAAAPATALAARGSQAATTGAQAVRGALVGGGAGATEGAIYGSGIQEDGGRLESAAENALIGSAAGAALGGVAPIAIAGARRLLQNFRGTTPRKIADELGVSPQAAVVIRNALNRGDMDKAAQDLARYGDQAMLADAGQGARELLDAATTAGDDAGRIAREAVEARATSQYGELNKTMDSVFGKPVGRETARQAIRSGSAGERRALYDAAYAQPIDYASGRGRRLEALLRRVPRAAITRANQMMQEAGEESSQIIARMGDDGGVTFDTLPDVRQNHYIMQALDDLIEQQNARGVLGGTTTQGNIRGNLRREMSEQLQALAPKFGEAQSRVADLARESRAVETGYSLLRPSTTRSQARQALEGATKAEKSAAKQGVRDYIEDQLANTRRIASDPNLDAREALSAMRLLTSRRAQGNIRLLLGRTESENLFNSLDEAAGALELRAAIAANSKTAIRGSIKDAVQEMTAPGVIETLVSGQPVEAGKRMIRALTGNSDEARALREAGIFEEVSRVLTNTRGPQAQQALKIIRDAKEADGLVSDGRADLLGRVLSRAFAETARQESSRFLEAR